MAKSASISPPLPTPVPPPSADQAPQKQEKQDSRVNFLSRSSMNVEDDRKMAAARLQHAKAQGKKRRDAISKPPIIVGSILFLPSGLFFLACKTLPVFGIFEGLKPYGWFGGCIGAVAVPILLVALLPEDIERIRLVTKMIVAIFAFAGCCASALVLLAVMSFNDGCKDVFGTSGTVPCWFAKLSILWPVLFGLGYITTSLYLWKRSQTLPARDLLSRVWKALGSFYFYLGWIVFPLAWVPRLAFEELDLDSKALAVLCAELGVLGLIFLLNDRIREDLQRWLAWKGAAINSAAAVASLIGQRTEAELFQMLNNVFTGVPLDRVSKASIKSNQPDAELNKLAENKKFGNVDAFFSHSWHDDADKKWEAIQLWRKEYLKHSHGKEAVVWIDKYCIDQNHIMDSLAVLPLSLAGCQRLVIFYGPTYLSRLWCIIELFIFIEMGKDVKDIELRKLDVEWKKGIGKMRHEILTFDAGSCDCYSKDDKARMMTLIEAGCGSVVDFSEKVKALLLDLSLLIAGGGDKHGNYRRLSEVLESMGDMDIELGVGTTKKKG
ncbi:hypothetical protein TrVE_jg867 [Triparma verrucosa]|uniref:Uncharacterized protein n=1 Tax=Triparma verrucosa TaxID=1606542 RepID=A0A9W7BQM1_9STRA|nr:hypothetical protein TrVE_jg867 [Triparma verrucosa]